MTISITKSNPNHQNILRSQTLFSYQIRFFSSRLKKTRDPFVWGNNLFCSSVFHAISLVRFTASCIRLVNTVVFGESNTVITLLLSGHKTNHPNHIISHNMTHHRLQPKTFSLLSSSHYKSYFPNHILSYPTMTASISNPPSNTSNTTNANTTNVDGVKVQCLQEVYNRNNAGISLISTGDFPNGLRYLSSALAIINRYVNEYGYGHDAAIMAVTNTDTCSPQLGTLSMQQPSHSRTHTGDKSSSVHEQENSLFYVCREAIVFCERPSYTTPATTAAAPGEDICLATSIVLYNIGLTFHELGLVTGSRTKLVKANRMYHECANVLNTTMMMQHHRQAGEMSPSVLQTLQIALVARNNQASIAYLHQADFEMSSSLLDDVRRGYQQFMTTMTTTTTCPTSVVFDEVIMEELVLNLATLIRPPVGAPCA